MDWSRQYDTRRHMHGNRGSHADGRHGQSSQRRPPPEQPRERQHRDRSRERTGGGGGGRFGGRRTQDEQYEVMTNYFKVSVDLGGPRGGDTTTAQTGTWFEYRATIILARRVRKKGPDGEPIGNEFDIVPRQERNPTDGSFLPGTEKELSMEKGATELSERIMIALQKKLLEQQQSIAVDGGPMVIASRRLDDLLMDQTLYVSVKKDCSDDDFEFKDQLPNTFFIVKLEEVGLIEFQRTSSGSIWPLQEDKLQKLSQCINIINKNTLLNSNCRSFTRNANVYYFPENIQQHLRGRRLFNQNEYHAIAPFVGLAQSARPCHRQQMYVSSNTKIGWINLEKESGKWIPLLDVDHRKIAGVQVKNGFGGPVAQEELIAIKAALEKISFHVKFLSRNLLSEGQQEGNLIIKPNLRLLGAATSDASPSIVKVANDPELYKFERKGVLNGMPTEYTVFTYMKERHGVTLKYPEMPMIHTKLGYFPVEFLYQAKGLFKGEISESQKKVVLQFHDETGGIKKIPSIKTAIEKLDPTVEEQFGLSITRKPEPLTLPATKLAMPSLEFGNMSQEVTDKGSWNLRHNKFLKPASTSSYAVVDFSSSRQPDAVELTTHLLDHAAQMHGLLVQNVQNQKDYRHVTESLVSIAHIDHNRSMFGQVYQGITRAIENAKQVFLYDSTFFFRDRKVMFDTFLIHPEKGTTRCMIYPMDHPDDQSTPSTLGVIFPSDIMQATHKVSVAGSISKARMHIEVSSSDKARHFVDPFDFRWSAPSDALHNPGLHWEARLRSGPTHDWQRVRFEGYAWRLLQEDTITKDARVVECVQCSHDWTIDCPSIIFVVLRENSKELYKLTKLVTNFCEGIQSQCLVWKSFKNQRSGPAQYLSNLAIKVNAKLANSFNKAQTWDIGSYRSRRGMPWISEVATMIMGISTSKGTGKAKHTVVAATVALTDNHSCMKHACAVQVQSKRDGIEPEVMKSTTEALASHFYQHTGDFPKRVLVFRDGVSEGNLADLEQNEVGYIREALFSLSQRLNCDALNPTITFIVCWNNHQVQIVPSHGNAVPSNRNVENVPSGTCVNSMIMPFKQMDISGDSASDFLLTAQGGLKGTSKPVFYRVVLNENALTQEILQAIVFGLSFCYGTATKATRRLSVTQYSKRLAEQFQSYLPYIDGTSNAIHGLPMLVMDSTGKFMIRKENESDNGLSDLLPGFSACPSARGSRFHSPFHPHLAA